MIAPVLEAAPRVDASVSTVGESGGPISAPMVAALEAAWAAIRVRHPEVPAVVMVLGAGSIGATRGGLKLGHFAAMRWADPDQPAAGAAAIDWSLPGVRIAEQRPRFVPNTMRRIKLGCDRIDGPFIAELRGGSSTARSVRQPLATIATSGNHHRLVRPDPGGPLAECRTRMLVPVELQAAMGFRAGYTVLGTDEQRKLQIGNDAVTPCASEFLLGAVVDALAAQPDGVCGTEFEPDQASDDATASAA